MQLHHLRRPVLACLGALFTLTAMAACGSKAPPAPATALPATTAPATAAPATTAPATSAPATAAPATTAPEAADAGAAPTPETAAETTGADPSATANEGEWLVWTAATGKNGFPAYTTTWIKAGPSAVEEVATRAEAVLTDGGHLFAVRESWKPVDEFDCPQDLEFNNYPKPGQKPTAVTTTVSAQLVDLLGGEKRWLTGEPAADAPKRYIGSLDEDWQLRGAANGVILMRDAVATYDCGAHGDSTVSFAIYGTAKAGGTSQEALLKAIEAKIPDVMKAASKELIERDDGDPGDRQTGDLFAWALVAKGGKVQVEYQVAHGTSWAANDQEAGGYTASAFIRADAPVAELGLGEIPAAVKAFAAQKALDGTYIGWSSVAGLDRDKVLAAFKDAATIPTEVRPGRVTNEAGAAAGAGDEGGATTPAKLIEAGRKATIAKDYDGAIAAFDQALAGDAKAAAAFSGRGYAKLLKKDYDAAKADLEKALELGTEAKFQAPVWFNLGLVAEGKKDTAAAKAAYAKSLELRPNAAVQKRLDRLK